MTKKEMQDELTRREVKFNVRDTSEMLEKRLEESSFVGSNSEVTETSNETVVEVPIILDPNVVSSTLEDDITPYVIEGVTLPLTEVVKPVVETGDLNRKIHFISPITPVGSKYTFTTQDYQRKVIEKFILETDEDCVKKIKELLRKK